MENSLENLTNNVNLSQSILFEKYYKNDEVKQIHTFNDLSVNNLNDWYNSVLNKYNFLNDKQVTNFQNFWKSLDYILSNIDPEKLKINVDSNREELDLLLWKESNNGISKLSFDKFGQMIFSFNGNDGKKVRGVFDEKVDFEALLFRFLFMTM